MKYFVNLSFHSGTFLCPVIITLHKQQSGKRTQMRRNTACGRGLHRGLRLLQHALCILPAGLSGSIMWKYTLPQKQGIVDVITGTFLDKNLEKAK